MDKNISFEEMFKRIKSTKSPQEIKRMQELAGVPKKTLPLKLETAINKFKQLLNDASDEIERNRGNK
jgi:hypothetical protein